MFNEVKSFMYYDDDILDYYEIRSYHLLLFQIFIDLHRKQYIIVIHLEGLAFVVFMSLLHTPSKCTDLHNILKEFSYLQNCFSSDKFLIHLAWVALLTFLSICIRLRSGPPQKTLKTFVPPKPLCGKLLLMFRVIFLQLVEWHNILLDTLIK